MLIIKENYISHKENYYALQTALKLEEENFLKIEDDEGKKGKGKKGKGKGKGKDKGKKKKDKKSDKKSKKSKKSKTTDKVHNMSHICKNYNIFL